MIRFLVLSILVVFAAFPAQAGILEFLFPTLRNNGPQPSETLQAPFADPQEIKKEDADKPKAAPETSIPLEFPHRSGNAISAWAVMAVSESLMFDEKTYSETLKDTEKYFSSNGRAAYMKSLAALNVPEVAQSSKYALRSFVIKDPLLLNEGKVDDRFRWLYDVPVSLTTMERGVKTYDDAKPTTRDVRIRVQLGRTDRADNPDGMWIETWEATPIKDGEEK